MRSLKYRKVILGSASPRRKQLLQSLFPDLEIRAGSADEDFPSELRRAAIPVFLAEHKAASLAGTLGPDELLLTADTIVWFNNQVLNKPSGREEALDMLRQLAGNPHQVYTGVCLTASSRKITLSVESTVTFRKASDKELEEYIDQYRPFDKAGSYGAQECLPEGMNPLSAAEKKFLAEIGIPDLFENSLAVREHARIALIQKIDGSYFNVMGLPLVELVEALRKEFGFQ